MFEGIIVFTPTEMKKVKILVFDDYLEDIMEELSEAAVFHMVDVGEKIDEWEGVTPVSIDETHGSCNDILRKVNQLIDILHVSETTGDAEYIKSQVNELRREKTTLRRLEDISGDLGNIEEVVSPVLEKIDEINAKISVLEELRSELAILDKHSVDLKLLEPSPILYSVAGIIDKNDMPALDAPPDDLNDEYVLSKSPLNEDLLLVMTTTQANKEVLNQFLSSLNFKTFSACLDGRSLEEIKEELMEIKKEKSELEDRLEDLSKEHQKSLLIWRNILDTERQMIEAGNMLGKTEKVYALEGWIPQKEVNELVKRVQEASNKYVFIKVEDPRPEDDVPTSLENPRLVKPFEVLTETFGLPRYDEIDPTPVLAVTFPMIFGLMFGDFGHGLMVALIGLALFTRGKNAIKDLGFITLTCGVSAIVFGILYNDFFGLHGTVFGLPEKPLWINPVHDAKSFLITAIAVGAIHISIGFLLGTVKLIKNKQYIHALTEPITKLWLYWGIISTLCLTVLQPEVDIIPLIIPLVVLPFLILALSDLLKHLPDLKPKDIVGLLCNGAFEAADSILIFLSNTISYSRIFALVLVHAGLFCALFEVVGALVGIDVEHLEHHGIELATILSPNGLIWFVTIAIGTVAILALEGLIVFLHTLRLHYYEWFTKFFDGGGTKYRPFTIKRVYTCT